MTDKTTFNQWANEAKRHLIKGELRSALSSMMLMGDGLESATHRQTCQRISNDYEAILASMQEGANDSSRAHSHTLLLQEAIREVESMRHMYRVRTAGDIYSRTWHAGPYNNNEDINVALSLGRSFALTGKSDVTFNLLWTSPQLTEESKGMVARIMEEEGDSRQTAYYVSALMLALLEFFDAAKIDLLLRYCDHKDADIRSRAVVGTCLTTQLHAPYLAFFPTLFAEVGKRLRREELIIVQHDLCIYRESVNIRQRIEEEILPHIAEARGRRAKLGFEENVLDFEEMSAHMDKDTRRRIEGNLREIAGMFVDGMDINLDTFGTMKSFGFFSHPCNWLVPYEDGRHGVSIGGLGRKFKLCDADRYSLALYLGSLPEKERDEAVEHMTTDDAVRGAKDNEKRSVEEAYHNVLQCLNRLLNRSPWKGGWPNVFSEGMILLNNPALSPTLSRDREFLHKTAGLLLRHKHNAEALRHFKALVAVEGGSAELYTAMGLCHRGMGNMQEAVSFLREATAFAPDDRRYMDNLAACLDEMGEKEDRLNCLLELERLYPNDEKTTVDAGLCLMDLGRWKEAQERFLRLEFTSKRPLPSARAVAWCALMLKDLTRAEAYYRRLLEEGGKKSRKARGDAQRTRWEDCLNLAHTEWLMGNETEAINLYKRYVSLRLSAEGEAAKGVADVLAPFDEDSDKLLHLGMMQTDIYLLRDILSREVAKPSV